jgi:chromosomal replication initiator protein
VPLSEQKLWSHIKKNLQEKFQGKLLLSVLNTATLESFTSQGQKHLTIKVPSAFHQNILKSHLGNIQTQVELYGAPYKTINIKKAPFNTSSAPSVKTLYSSYPPSPAPTEKKIQKTSSFSSNWTFSSFVQGPNNCFAFSLAKSIALQPLKNNSNPLFIYGPSGMGKTHLLHAIGNTLEKEKPHLKVCYLPTERFFNDCINHIRKNSMSAFRQKYRKNIHVLLLDDIQILGKGESIQEEFFHTFESLKQGNCQIVLASDQKPKNIKGLKERIRTRFAGGVIADIQSPDKDTKTAIIRDKAKRRHLKLSNEIISCIANTPSCSIREIEGHLNKIKMFCELQSKPLSLSLAQELFSGELEKTSHPISSFDTTPLPKASIKTLQKGVCSLFNIKTSDLKSRSRSKHLVQARNLAIYVAREDLKLSLSEIGFLFGNRNHSTVLNSLKRIKQQQNNCDLNKNLQKLRMFINKKSPVVEKIS